MEIKRDHKWVCAWLLLGVVMVFIQILVGGVTRLTGSGLSITKWEIVTGTLPPLGESDWQDEFEKYKATPQYQRINEGMALSSFKFIYFWEYIHRLWARSMGFVFLIPFFIFLFRKSLVRDTIKRLLVVIALAAAAAVFGWIMVASGLIERPWVNAYKLTIHLSLGISLFIYLFYTWLKETGHTLFDVPKNLKSGSITLLVLVVLQIILGGLVSGMKAALAYPTWPDMYGVWLPDILLDSSHWSTDTFLFYDQSLFMPALVQFLHRNTAYLILILSWWFAFSWLRKTGREHHWIVYGLLGIIVVQLGLGILTLVGSIGSIPVLYGALHQGVGILLLTYLFYVRLVVKPT